MEFQIAEAVELIKTLAETENVTHTQALQTFVAEAGLDIEDASILKAALFEEYTLQEMASDTLTRALHNVFVAGDSDESLQEMDTKETQEGTKYKIRVKDRASNSSYVRYATREKIAELRANPNISSVELTDHGQAGEDNDGSKTAAAKGGGGDRDGDGKVESGSKEHAGVVHNAIQKRMGGTPDGQDTRKEEVEVPEALKNRRYKTDGKKVTSYEKDKDGKEKVVHTREAFDPKGAARMDAAKGKKKETEDETNKRLMLGKHSPAAKYGKKKEVEEGIDFKGAARKQAAMDAEQKKKDDKSPSSKDRRLMMGKFRPGASKEEKAEGGRDSMREKGTSPTKGGKKMYEQYLELRASKLAERFEVTDADEKGNTEAYKRFKAGNPAYTKADSKKKVETTKEEWKPDPTEKRKAKGAKLGREEEIERGKSKKYGRDEDKIKDLYKRRIAVDFKKKKSTIGEDVVLEGDLTNAGSENQGERDRKKLTGKGVDNSTSIKLMPAINETVKTDSPLSIAERKLAGKLPAKGIVADLADRMGIVAEECCPKCGTPECTCEGKKEEKPKKKREPKAKLDEAGMPITEYVSTGPTKEMVAPPRDAEGAKGVMNPKGVAKRYKRRGEAPGDRRPNDITGPDLPNERGTVPSGSGV